MRFIIRRRRYKAGQRAYVLRAAYARKQTHSVQLLRNGNEVYRTIIVPDTVHRTVYAFVRTVIEILRANRVHYLDRHVFVDHHTAQQRLFGFVAVRRDLPRNVGVLVQCVFVIACFHVRLLYYARQKKSIVLYFARKRPLRRELTLKTAASAARAKGIAALSSTKNGANPISDSLRYAVYIVFVIPCFPATRSPHRLPATIFAARNFCRADAIRVFCCPLSLRCAEAKEDVRPSAGRVFLCSLRRNGV